MMDTQDIHAGVRRVSARVIATGTTYGCAFRSVLPVNARRSRVAQSRRRMVGVWLARAGWALTVGTATLLGFAYLLPQDLWNTGAWYLGLCGVAFLVRLLQLHIGVMLILLACCSVASRRRNLALTSLL